MKMGRKAEQIEERIENATPFDVDIAVGLTKGQVEIRRGEKLTNKVVKHPTKTIPQILVDNIFNYLNIFLLVVCIIMIRAGLKWTNFTFAAVLLLNIAIGVYQDIHARVLVSRLQVVADPKAVVLREGKTKTISGSDLVLDDIILLSSGDQIVADSVIVEGECEVNESLLTGESLPVKKQLGAPLLSGTYLTKGHVKARVAKVGSANYAETLQNKASAFSRPASEIRRSVTTLMGFTGLIATFIGIADIITYGLQTNDWLGYWTNVSAIESLSGSMIAMLPAGMFLLTSLCLSVGVITLSKKRMLVQQLYCIEMLARVDVLCLDKTGTLTDGTMSVEAVRPIGAHSEGEIASAVASILHYSEDTNATARAMRERFGIDAASDSLAAIPFDSTLKYSAVTLKKGGTYAFGAYGFVPSPKNAEVEALIDEYAKHGFRVVVVSHSPKPIQNGVAPKEMELIGVVAIVDHIKDDAKETIGWFQGNDVAVRVISGDDPRTVSSIAARCGILHSERFVSLEGKSDPEVIEFAKSYTVFGRVTPEQKALLISSFKKQGHKVAMTGDGVNDILALKVADCSIAMASGSDAAKSVSHLISLDDNFAKLPDVVHAGRRVINNLQRSCSLFLNKTFFAMALSLIFLVSTWFDGPSYPFKPSNLFLWETLSIGLSSFFYALQPSDERLKGSFLQNIFSRSLPGAMSEVLVAVVPIIIAINAPNLFGVADKDIAYSLAISMGVLLITIQSFVVLGKISFPFNAYRFLVFLGCVILAALIFWYDGVAELNLIGVTYVGLSPNFVHLLLIIAGGGIVFYFVLVFLTHLIMKYARKRGSAQ